jgi:hypothetical protein
MDWKKEMLFATIIYRLDQINEVIPFITAGTEFEFIDKELLEMSRENLIEHVRKNDELVWQIADKGRVLQANLLKVYDQLINFEVFSNVNLTVDLPESFKAGSTNDPRFIVPRDDIQSNMWQSEDLRLAMITFSAEAIHEVDMSPHKIVFLQNLIDGYLETDNLWVDLKFDRPFKEVESLVDNSYKWTNVAEDIEEAKSVMQSIYTAGMLEQQYKDSIATGSDEDELDDSELEEGFEDELEEDDEFEEEEFETFDIIVEPYGYYDPYDPYLDSGAFGVLSARLW